MLFVINWLVYCMVFSNPRWPRNRNFARQGYCKIWPSSASFTLLHILKNNCHTITNFLLSIEYQWTKAMIVGMIDADSIYHTITNHLSDIFLHMTYFQ